MSGRSSDSASPVIRPARVSDAARLAALNDRLMAEHRAYSPLFEVRPESEAMVAGYLRRMLRTKTHRAWIAEAGGEAVGYLWVVVQERPPIYVALRIGCVLDLYVAKPWRRRGIGRALVNLATSWCREQGLGHVELMAASKNRAGLAAWRSYGFREYGRHLHSTI